MYADKGQHSYRTHVYTHAHIHNAAYNPYRTYTRDHPCACVWMSKHATAYVENLATPTNFPASTLALPLTRRPSTHPFIYPPAQPRPNLAIRSVHLLLHPNQQPQPHPPYRRIPTHERPTDPSICPSAHPNPNRRRRGLSDEGHASSVHSGKRSHARLD